MKAPDFTQPALQTARKSPSLSKELGVNYETTHVDVSKNTQKQDWYLKSHRKTFLRTGSRDNPTRRGQQIAVYPRSSTRTPIAEGKTREKRVFGGQSHHALPLSKDMTKAAKSPCPF
jgi:glutathione S-transferase